MTLTLFMAQWRAYRTRLVLALSAMLACVTLVVWLVGSFEALVKNFDSSAEEYMGTYHAYLGAIPSSTPADKAREAGVAPGFLEALAKRAEFSRMDPMWQSRITVTPAKGFSSGSVPQRERMGIPPINPLMVGNTMTTAPVEVVEGRWPDMAQGGNGVAIGSGAAKRMNIRVGDEIVVITDSGHTRLKIEAIVSQSMSTPGILMASAGRGMLPALASIYVPMETARAIQSVQPSINLVGVQLAPGISRDRLENILEAAAREAGTGSAASQVGISDVATLTQVMSGDRAVKGHESQMNSAAGMVMACCIFIIFTTLSMGVNEQVAQFALMRAVGLRRGQIARLVFGEAVVLGVVACAGGVVLGYGLLEFLHDIYPEVYTNRPVFTLRAIGVAAGCSLGGSLLAACLPAWRATRIAPLEAAVLANQGNPLPGSARDGSRSLRSVLPVTFLGVLVLGISPAIIYWPGIGIDFRQELMGYVGYASMLAGTILVTPACVVLCETCFTPFVARLTGLRPELLEGNLTRQLGRTSGTVMSLSVGLGLFISANVWVYSMVVPFVPGKTLPDALVGFLPTGIPDSEWSKVRGQQGVKQDEFLPLAVEQVMLAPRQSEDPAWRHIKQDNVLICGLDLDKALQGTPATGGEPMLKQNFIKGNLHDALALMRKGRHVLVPQSLASMAGLDVGSKIVVLVPGSESEIEYSVAGVIDFDGWHWLTKTSGMRRQVGGQTAGLLLSDFASVRRDYHLRNLQFFWFNVEPGTDLRSGNAVAGKASAPGEESRSGKGAGRRGRESGAGGKRPEWNSGNSIDPRGSARESGKLETAMQNLAAANAGQPIDTAGHKGIVAQKPYAKITARDAMTAQVEGMARKTVDTLGQLPLIGLGLTSLALVNTLLASVRARYRELGLLRCIGVSRFAIFRLILAESLLMGICTVLLSSGFGMLAAWGTIHACTSRFGYFFGSVTPPVVFPWRELAPGYGLAFGVCLFAALIPALAAARRPPLELLHE